MEENNNKQLKRTIKVSLELMLYMFYILKMYDLNEIFCFLQIYTLVYPKSWKTTKANEFPNISHVMLY